MRRAKLHADMQLLYRQQNRGARKFLAEKTAALTAGIRPYVNIQHELYTRTVDKTRGLEQKASKSQQFIGRTHSYYLRDSKSTANFAHWRGRDLKVRPHSSLTPLPIHRPL